MLYNLFIGGVGPCRNKYRGDKKLNKSSPFFFLASKNNLFFKKSYPFFLMSGEFFFFKLWGSTKQQDKE